MIDWFSPEHEIRLNPRMPAPERARLEAALATALATGAFAEPHLFLVTSGTTSAGPGALKWVALAKRAFRAGARAANASLQSDARDVWLHALPDFHVGGLAIRARAQLVAARVERGPEAWDAAAFVARAAESSATLASLVPAQLHDLVRGGYRAPARLRAVLLGGGALGEPLWRASRELGWPILPTYGMTECGSQVATAALSDLARDDYPPLRLLPHLSAEVSADGRIRLRGSSLLTAYITVDGVIVDPKVSGWLTTDDRGTAQDGVLRISGRTRDLVKVGAENVDLARLDAVLDEVLRETGSVPTGLALFASPDERLGCVIHAAAPDPEAARAAVAAFNARVFPYEQVRRVHRVSAIPRTELGKLNRARLAELALTP
jgi:O-succinylbenzoic acid--CoA ligase